MRTSLKIMLGSFVYCSTLVVVLVVAAFWWGAKEFTTPSDHTIPVEITIEKGMNINRVADILQTSNIIDPRESIVFQVVGRVTGQASRIKAGEYEIPAQASMKQILALLESGKTIQRNVTIPEGLTSFEIVRLLNENKTLKQMTGTLAIPPEGSLLPETYSFTRSETAADILARMQAAMTEKSDALWAARAEGLPFQTKEEAMILASIVEKETGVPHERARIAGVFINRLRQGMPLQTDPTVIYALTNGQPKNDGQGPLGRRLLRADLEFDSPYNTYRYAGLPPTPIANPGGAAIEATLHPEAHEFIYFVADGTGGHAFARTLVEHNENVAKWRKVRSAQ